MISDYLGYGKENARTASELAQLLGMTDRDVTRSIELERRSGTIICAGNEGFYKPECPADAEAYLRSRDLRLRTIRLGSEAMRISLDTWIGQTSLDSEVHDGGVELD